MGKVKCWDCQGTGRTAGAVGTMECGQCYGKGQVDDNHHRAYLTTGKYSSGRSSSGCVIIVMAVGVGLISGIGVMTCIVV